MWSFEPTLKESDIRAALLSDAPGSGAAEGILARQLTEGFELESVLDEVRRHYVERARTASAGNKSRAARLLGLNSHHVLSNWTKRLGMDD